MESVVSDRNHTITDGHQSKPSVNEVFNALQTTFREDRWFKIHTILAVAFTFSNFLAWLIVDTTDRNYGEAPWFLFIPVFFLFSLTFHFWRRIQRPDYLFHVHLLLYSGSLVAAVIARVLWPTQLAQSVAEITLAFLFPFLTWGIVLAFHYFKFHHQNSKERWIYFHTSCFVIVNLMALAVWSSLWSHIFWVVWPFCILLLPLAIHWNLHFHPKHYIRLHFGIYLAIQLLMLLTWLVGGRGFPWWGFPFLVWTGALLGHSAIFQYVPPPTQPTIPPELTSSTLRSHFRKDMRMPRKKDRYDGEADADPKIDAAINRSLAVSSTIPLTPPSAPPLVDSQGPDGPKPSTRSADLPQLHYRPASPPPERMPTTSHQSRSITSTLDPSTNRRYVPPDQREFKDFTNH
eukprot:TRINITY_DN19694_c0_g1_i1.p1 TRINITY_DN19694_c0_g1~~TRINITY_DN19694_c0_g1_i1.p1  ORF type:complete len:403 (-),score=36.47 TRINITY_DN19694_c0_g1_i1:35-1243(-)